MPFTGGFLAGYLIYDELHYHLHHRPPTTRLGRGLRELHMRHHFQDDERGFGYQRALLGPRLRHVAEAPDALTSSAPVC